MGSRAAGGKAISRPLRRHAAGGIPTGKLRRRREESGSPMLHPSMDNAAMPDLKHLDAALNQLRSEIEGLGIGDDVARQRLERVIRDIETTLADPQRAGDDGSLVERLKRSVLGFEASHPRI